MSAARFVSRGVLLTIAVMLVAAPAAAADDSDLAARAASWEKDYNAGDLKAVAAHYTEDGCRMPPNQTTVRGREAILAQLEAGREQGVAQVKIAVTSAETNGDMAYGMGTFEILSAEGSALDQGKWMNVSKKVDGEWMTHCDIFNSDLPIPSAVPE